MTTSSLIFIVAFIISMFTAIALARGVGKRSTIDTEQLKIGIEGLIMVLTSMKEGLVEAMDEKSPHPERIAVMSMTITSIEFHKLGFMLDMYAATGAKDVPKYEPLVELLQKRDGSKGILTKE